MRLLRYCDGFHFSDHDDNPPPYAILSHTWSENNNDEVLYQDVLYGTAKDLTKLNFCRDQAAAAKLEYFWIDTCCIDKRNEAEVAYAIRSMYRWYDKAALCFVYLPDVSIKKRKAVETDTVSWQESFKSCRWFTRGWTLQEMIASKDMEFFARDGHLGSRETLSQLLHDVTGIDLRAPMPDHRTRLGWIANRVTKKPEDKAYCMMGICGVMLGPQYGEGELEARRRLENAIVQRYGSIALEDGVRGHVEQNHRQTILDLLRFDAMESRRTTIATAMKKTCRWILESPVCRKWLNLENSFFWIKGKPGAGKSVMVKFLDEHIKHANKQAVRLSFYFTARGEQLEKTFAGMYRSLLVQLLDAVPELHHVLDKMKYSRACDIPQIQNALVKGIQRLDGPVHFFIDAVDECQDQDVQDMIDFFENLQDGLADIFVCFASRHYPIYEIPTRLQLVLEETGEHTSDLEQFVRTNLRLNGLTPKRREAVVSQIISKANGVFLWVVLVVKILQKEVSGGRMHALQARLDEIPPGLSELFQDILRRDQDNMDEFILCLRWILYAKRPLKLQEFYFAMMAGLPPNDLEWVSDDIAEEQMQSFLLTSSKGFAELTKGSKSTAQFIHESVRDFLIKDNGFHSICRGSAESLECVAQQQLMDCCFRGLAFEPQCLKDRDTPGKPLNEDQRRLLTTRYPFAEYATTYILHHADNATKSLPEQNFLVSKFSLSDWTVKFNSFQKYKTKIYKRTPTFSYVCAERNLMRLIGRPCSALSPEKQRYRTPLIAAFMSASWDVARIFLEDMGAADVDKIISEAKRPHAKYESSPKTLLSAPWRWAIRNGLEYLAKYLLSSVPVTELTAPRSGTHALFLAIEGGNVAIAKHLLSMSSSILHAAGKSDVYHSRQSRHPLVLAAMLGRDEFIDLLLKVRIDVDAQEDDYGNALYAASERGYENVVELLLAKGADVNAQGEPYGNALQAASIRGHEKVVELLLARGADVNAQGGHFGNALQAASFGGYEKIAEILLAKGADFNAQGGHFGNALQAASFGGYEKIAEILLAKVADVNAQGGIYGNALRAASQGGHKTVIEMLLVKGANNESKG